MELYVKEHFSFEEKCLAACSYEQTPGHVKEHQKFLGKTKEFRKRSKTEDPLLLVEMLGYLEEWFLHHVLVVDREYVETFKKCGIR